MGTRSPLFVRKQSGGMFSIEPQSMTTGDHWFVDSTTGTDGAGYGQNPDAPCATLDYAIGLATADKGDTIWVMPNHSESSSTTNAELFDVDKAAISVIGLGVGDKRPTFTLEEAGVTVVLGAAGCRLSNLRFIGNITDLVACLEIEAAADGCIVDHCYFADSATNLDMLVAVAVAADADRLLFEHNVMNITTGGEATHAINFAGGCDGLIMRHNTLVGDWKDAAGAIDLATAASVNILIHDNFIVNEDGSAGLISDIHASTTGGMFRNFAAGSKNNTETITGGEAMHFSENYGTDVVASSGIITPSTMTAWS